MSWRWRIGELFGIVIYAHVTFLLLVLWVALTPLLAGYGLAGALSGVLLILLLFACIVAHEYGHALTARRYGIETRDITLLPIGGVARLERMPRDPVQELWVAIAGPAVNVGIGAALLALGVLLAGPGFVSYVRMDISSAAGRLAATHPAILLIGRLAFFNFWIVLFNLVPAFPMDGGRVLRALLAQRMDYAQATRTAANVGQMLAFAFGISGLLIGNVWWMFIALFVYMGAEAEAQMVQVQTAFRGLPVRRVMVTRFTALAPEDPLSRAVQLLLADSQQDFPVVEDGVVVGLLTRRDLLSALHELGPAAPVAEAMQREVAPVEAGAPLEETFQRMQSEDLSALPVVEGGRLVGMLTMENIAEFLMIRAALEGAPPGTGDAVPRTAAGSERPSWTYRRRGHEL